MYKPQTLALANDEDLHATDRMLQSGDLAPGFSANLQAKELRAQKKVWVDRRGCDVTSTPGQDKSAVQCKVSDGNRVSAGALAGDLGGGQTIPDNVRGQMESAFGQDFSTVRVQEHPVANQLDAQAFASGEQIVFAPGNYLAQSSTSQRLLAHELTHVIQQREGRASTNQGGRIVQSAVLENEPDTYAERAIQSKTDQAGSSVTRFEGARSTGSSRSQQASKAPVQCRMTATAPRETTPNGPKLAFEVTDFTQLSGQDLDWDKSPRDQGSGRVRIDPIIPAGFDEDATLREIFEAHQRERIEALLSTLHPGPYDSLDLDRPMDPREVLREWIDHLSTVDPTASDDLRKRFFALSQRALIATLNVTSVPKQASRYGQTIKPTGGYGKTKCNVYAHDFVRAMGGYLPSVWWDDPEEVLARMRRGETVEPTEANTGPIGATPLCEWLEEWGTRFGWETLRDDPDAAQEAANSGRIVVLSSIGHITVVIAEDPHAPVLAPSGRDLDADVRSVWGGSHGRARSRFTPEMAERDHLGVVVRPLQSQAGGRNDDFFTRYGGGGEWWKDKHHRRPEPGKTSAVISGSFWVWRGNISSPLAAPDQWGHDR